MKTPTKQTGAVSMPPLIPEQVEYLQTALDAILNTIPEECTCVIGGPKPEDYTPCPVHER